MTDHTPLPPTPPPPEERPPSLLKTISRLWQQFRRRPYLTLLSGIDKLTREVTGRPTWRFGRIAPQIILGGQPARRILPILARAGVTGVVNLRKEFDYERDIGGAKLRYLYLPTVDNEAPSLEHLALGVNFIKEEVTKGGSVYIHCWEGLGRGPTMTAAYLVSTGLSPQAAWERIRSIRPFIRPNKLQTEQLERFAAQYAQHGEAPAPVEQAAEVKTLAQSQKDMPEPLHKSPQSDHGQ